MPRKGTFRWLGLLPGRQTQLGSMLLLGGPIAMCCMLSTRETRLIVVMGQGMMFLLLFLCCACFLLLGCALLLRSWGKWLCGVPCQSGQPPGAAGCSSWSLTHRHVCAPQSSMISLQPCAVCHRSEKRGWWCSQHKGWYSSSGKCLTPPWCWDTALRCPALTLAPTLLAAQPLLPPKHAWHSRALHCGPAAGILVFTGLEQKAVGWLVTAWGHCDYGWCVWS